MAGLSLSGVSKSFGGSPALWEIDLVVPDGELCVVAGPAGSGKTTLLRLIAGLEGADTGTIEIDGEAVDGWSPRQRDVSMVFQRDALLPAKSVFDSIAFGLRAQRVSREEIAARVERIAAALGMTGSLLRPVGTLSEADRRRTAIGRALVRGAGLCLIDEPLAGFEIGLRDEMGSVIRRLHRDYPSTMLYATQNAVEAMTLAERTIVLNKGRIEQDGTPLDLFERPKTLFVAGFIGWPRMNLLNGTLARGEAGDTIRLQPGDMSLKLPPNRVPPEIADGLPIVLGVRPEQMARAVRASPQDGMFRHEAEVEEVRPMGARSHLIFRIAGTPVVAELNAHDVSQPGERLTLDINLKRASLFDAATGKAL